MAASPDQRRPALRALPGTISGWVSVGLFVLSLLLLAGRIVLKPTFSVPLNFLVVFVAAGASGLVAAFAVVLRRERAVAVIAVLVIGLLAAAFLAAEWLGNP